MAAICDPITVPHEEEELVRILEEVMSSGEASLVGPDGQQHQIPTEVYSLFVQTLKALREGKAVSIIPYTRHLTTQQAARILGVSRQFLVGLLQSGKIPFRTVGTHRRVLLSDVLRYEKEQDEQTRNALRELSRASLEAGIYDKIYLPEE